MERPHPMIVPTVSDALPEDRTLGLAILGSTGSIGRQTLDVVDQHPDRFRVISLAAGRNAEVFADQIRKHQPKVVSAVSSDGLAAELAGSLNTGIDGLIAAALHPDVDLVVVATSGHASILPTIRSMEAGKIIALANKEAIVCAGELIANLAIKHGARLRPIDSEHSAIWQSLGRSDGTDVARLTLTASGGPFLSLSSEELQGVTASQAMAHPTWVMGGKITIDSATLMNKGLELIEAHWLFGTSFDRIDVVVHPESIIHSLVEFNDGSQVAQLGYPDMRLPIQYALTFPRHERSSVRRLSLTDVGALRFVEPDPRRFPALRLAREAGIKGRSYPTVLSAADEEAVAAFAAGRIGYWDLVAVIERTLTEHEPWDISDLEALAAAEAWGRTIAAGHVESISRRS